MLYHSAFHALLITGSMHCSYGFDHSILSKILDCLIFVTQLQKWYFKSSIFCLSTPDRLIVPSFKQNQILISLSKWAWNSKLKLIQRLLSSSHIFTKKRKRNALVKPSIIIQQDCQIKTIMMPVTCRRAKCLLKKNTCKSRPRKNRKSNSSYCKYI